MKNLIRSALFAAVTLAPAAASAQYIVPEPAIIPEAAIMGQPPVVAVGPLTVDDAVVIAQMHGIAMIDEVDVRLWDGNFEVDGIDQTGRDLTMVIDRNTGAVLDIDD